MKKSKTSLEILLAIAAAALTRPATAQTEQLSVLPESGAAMGMVGGRLANVADPTALRYSPTMTLDILKPDMQINSGVWRANVKYTSPADETVRLQDLKFLGSLYFIYPIKPGELTMGIGLSTPFGLSYKYPRDSVFRYVLPYSGKLLTVDVTPTVAARINDSVSVAAGIDLVYSSLRSSRIFRGAQSPVSRAHPMASSSSTATAGDWADLPAFA